MDDNTKECLTDLVSHYNDFSRALYRMQDNTRSEADRLYWEHQIAVLDRMLKQAEKALAD